MCHGYLSLSYLDVTVTALYHKVQADSRIPRSLVVTLADIHTLYTIQRDPFVLHFA